MVDIKQFNNDYSDYGFVKACQNQGLEPFESDKGHLIASDGETYGSHPIKSQKGKRFVLGCWGDLAEWNKIHNLCPYVEND